VLAAATVYGAYHVGYGMGASEMVFLTGLGVVYATAFALTRSVVVLWPLLTPLGSLFAQWEGGDIELPWASIAGFADVLALMLVLLWLARRKIRRQAQVPPGLSAGGAPDHLIAVAWPLDPTRALASTPRRAHRSRGRSPAGNGIHGSTRPSR